MTALPIETVGGIEFGRCAVCKGRCAAERHGKTCFVCETYPDRSTYPASLLRLIAKGDAKRRQLERQETPS